MIKTRKNLRWFMIVILALFAMTIFVPVGSVIAEQSDLSLFEKTDVVSDLKSMNGFDFSKYPADNTSSPKILYFVEYCYSADKAITDKYYGLYLYVYNPYAETVLPIGNSVQMAVEYNADGSVSKYEKLKLSLLSVDDNKLYYKFRIADTDRFLGIVNPESRQYEISSFELSVKPENGVGRLKDYSVGGRYVYSGYSQGCDADPNSASTLDCDFRKTEVVKLDVHDAVYRTGESSLGEGHRNQVNSVAFSVPNYLIRDYGSLQKIQAEWWEYRTEPVVIVSEFPMYSAIYGARDKSLIGESTDFDINPYGLCYTPSGKRPTSFYYNVKFSLAEIQQNGNPTGQAFAVPNIFYDNSGDLKSYTLPSDTLLPALKNYPFPDGAFYPTRSDGIAQAVVNTNVGDGRKSGHNLMNINADDTFNLISYVNGAPSAWKRFWAKLGIGSIDYPEIRDISPIYIVEDSVLTASDAIVSSNLFWDKNKVSWLKEYSREAKASDKSTVLFRFAVTDYFSGVLTAYKNNVLYLGDGQGDDTEAIMSQENVFLDFDIISLTFAKNGEYTVIPAVSNPFDIVSDIAPPLSNPNIFDTIKDWAENVFGKGGDAWGSWGKWVVVGVACVIGLILLIVFFPFVVKILGWLFKGLWWLICLPFRGIAWLVRWIKERCGK